MFGGQKVGGIRSRAMCDIAKPVEVLARSPVASARSSPSTRSADATPTPTTPPEPTAAQVDACTDIAALDRMWQASGAERRAQIEARKVDLTNEPDVEPADEPTEGGA